MVVTVAMVATTIGTPQNQWCEDGVEGERMDGGRWWWIAYVDVVDAVEVVAFVEIDEGCGEGLNWGRKTRRNHRCRRRHHLAPRPFVDFATFSKPIAWLARNRPRGRVVACCRCWAVCHCCSCCSCCSCGSCCSLGSFYCFLWTWVWPRSDECTTPTMCRRTVCAVLPPTKLAPRHVPPPPRASRSPPPKKAPPRPGWGGNPRPFVPPGPQKDCFEHQCLPNCSWWISIQE